MSDRPALVPLANPLAMYESQRQAYDEALKRVLESGWYILGKEGEAFEREFAEFCQVKFCVGVANGTDAIALALRALGVGIGDEVITTSHSAVATACAIESTGAVPVFADIDPLTRCLSPESVESRITSKTKAIVPVHIYGHPADMSSLGEIAQKRGLRIVEDCAQAHGAKIGDRPVGGFGDIAAFSFYPTKNLGAFGDGGAVITSDEALFEKVSLLRQYGWKKRYVSEVQGGNSRLDELQASVLRVGLRVLPEKIARRREIAARYTKALSGSRVLAPKEVAGTCHAYHLYVVETEERERFMAFAESRGIGVGLHYPMAIHQQPAYVNYLREGQSLPETDRLYSRIVSLPMFPELLESEVSRVSEMLSEFR